MGEQTTRGQKRTKIIIEGADNIEISSPKGTMALEYRGGKLRAKAGGKELKLVPERMAEIAEAVAAYRPPVYAGTPGAARRYATSEDAWDAGDAEATFATQRIEVFGPEVLDEGTGEMVVMIGPEDKA